MFDEVLLTERWQRKITRNEGTGFSCTVRAVEVVQENTSNIRMIVLCWCSYPRKY